MKEVEENIEWHVLIDKIGLVNVVGTKDIDQAYINACKKYRCKIDDILAVGPIMTFELWHLYDKNKI